LRTENLGRRQWQTEDGTLDGDGREVVKAMEAGDRDGGGSLDGEEEGVTEVRGGSGERGQREEERWGWREEEAVVRWETTAPRIG
jgi:hypothetical protein